MALMKRPSRQQQDKLRKFRANFLHLISDGTFPPHRQQRLLQWCQSCRLSWEEARAFIAPDVARFFESMVAQVVGAGKVTHSELASLHKLQRQLGLPDDPSGPIQPIYDLVEQKLTVAIVERGASLSAAAAVESLRNTIAIYQLPDPRAEQLFAVLLRQHELSKLLAGTLPVVTPSIALAQDELCHLEVAATFTPAQMPTDAPYDGQLFVTSARLLMLAAAGGFALAWGELHILRPAARAVQLAAPNRSGTLSCADPQYLATLLATVRKRSISVAPAAPNRLDRRMH